MEGCLRVAFFFLNKYLSIEEHKKTFQTKFGRFISY